ncbi:E3 ubiquitin-protein ligase XIAP-like isoform X2 [Pecten maximus]|uniref:E3 ubiquitin-protein ligase XIAP-like isoform X2 n=1 Tax=Pecten maximus TaxID=6579 RepID=UPI001458DCC6|nr:E3 ubiquitin-protein ligase XIAP-like isoform X2 [Pecten maximus]
MNSDTHFVKRVSAVKFRKMNMYHYEHPFLGKKTLQENGDSHKDKEQRGTHLKMHMKKASLKNGKKDWLKTFSLSMNISSKGTSTVLEVNSEYDFDDISNASSSKNNNTHGAVLIANRDDLQKYVFVGDIETKTTEQDINDREPDERDEWNRKECDINQIVYMSKNPCQISLGRPCHPVMSVQYSKDELKRTDRHTPPVITNAMVLKGFLQCALTDLEKKGCFRKPPDRHNVLMPQTFESKMPPLTPIPIYPNDRNEQININPFYSLLNSYGQWPNESGISPSRLAEAGFHSIAPHGHLVGCRSCSIQLSIDDFNGNDPYTVHRQISPTCPAVHRGESISTPVQQEASGPENGIDFETVNNNLHRLQLDAPVENVTRRSEPGQIETINEEHTHLTARNGTQADSVQGASAASAASASSHPIVTYEPRNPGQRSPEVRRESFRNWLGRYQDIDNLVHSGFFFIGEEDIVRCFHCDIGLAEWDPSDDPWVEHARHSPDCPYLRGQRDDQFISGIQRSWAEIYTPKHPQMSQTSTRLETFGPTWPQNYVLQRPEQLAEAGFFYTGEADTVRCHYCDGGLQEWEPNDDPWTEHAKWFPFCKFVLKVKGLSFVQAAALPEENDGESENSIGVTSQFTRAEASYEEKCRKKEQENPMLSAAVESIKEFGYRKKMIKKAILVHVETSGKREFNARELMDIIFKLEEKESSLEEDGYESCSSSDEINFTPKAMAKENEYLKGKQLCDLCRKRDKCMLFLPCGHRSTCEPCGKGRTSCSVCLTEVTSCVKTFLG